jgi:hypothetical protein
MTQGLVIAPRPVVAPRPVIARNEAIQWPSHEDMDCHGAARLAMTESEGATRNDARQLPASQWRKRLLAWP